jgi:hypothetical protein
VAHERLSYPYVEDIHQQPSTSIGTTLWEQAILLAHFGGEAIAAAQFARCGFDVSVEYGADQPKYDLIVAKGHRLLKVSVKGSQDWGWGLRQSYLAPATKRSGKKADYHGAIALWLESHVWPQLTKP